MSHTLTAAGAAPRLSPVMKHGSALAARAAACILAVMMALAGLVLTPPAAMAQTAALDFATGNAAISVVQPLVVDATRQDFSPGGGDPSLLLRIFSVTANGWYDAIAPYHPTAVGVYSRLGRRPASESADNKNMNIAMLYASHKVLYSLFPDRKNQWDSMLIDLGLDPTNTAEDLSTPIGIGNAAGRHVVEGREHDGINALGDEGGRKHNLMPYSDYTGYAPVNTAYRLINPSRWQPHMVRVRNGRYQVQQFVTPQYRFTEPYAIKDATAYSSPAPRSSNYKNRKLYIAQAQNVLDESAKIDDRRKMLAELFDNKVLSLGGSGAFAANKAKLGLFDSVASNFFTNVATFDAGIVMWQEKNKYDAVRPFSAIHHLFKGKTVTAYMGAASGKVGEMPAEEWDSYLPVADHPEYPSGSACLCAAHAEFKRMLFGTDELGFSLTFPAGSSRMEPGMTPKSDVQVTFATWTEFEKTCGQSRVWAGVHFQAAVDEGLRLCPVFGDKAYDYMKTLLAGTAPERGPSHTTRK